MIYFDYASIPELKKMSKKSRKQLCGQAYIELDLSRKYIVSAIINIIIAIAVVGYFQVNDDWVEPLFFIIVIGLEFFYYLYVINFLAIPYIRKQL